MGKPRNPRTLTWFTALAVTAPQLMGATGACLGPGDDPTTVSDNGNVQVKDIDGETVWKCRDQVETGLWRGDSFIVKGCLNAEADRPLRFHDEFLVCITDSGVEDTCTQGRHLYHFNKISPSDGSAGYELEIEMGQMIGRSGGHLVLREKNGNWRKFIDISTAPPEWTIEVQASPATPKLPMYSIVELSVFDPPDLGPERALYQFSVNNGAVNFIHSPDGEDTLVQITGRSDVIRVTSVNVTARDAAGGAWTAQTRWRADTELTGFEISDVEPSIYRYFDLRGVESWQGVPIASWEWGISSGPTHEGPWSTPRPFSGPMVTDRPGSGAAFIHVALTITDTAGQEYSFAHAFPIEER